MAMEAHSCGEVTNFVVYDAISATPYSCNNDSPNTHIIPMKNAPRNQECFLDNGGCCLGEVETAEMQAVPGRKRKRRRAKVSKNKEEAETQRMTHITVERNRRKLMNEHLAVLRSLMPQSYIQMGDQASIVGGAIDFVEELEHILQSLEAQKYQQVQEEGRRVNGVESSTTLQAGLGSNYSTPFAQFFVQPQYYMSSRCCGENKYLCNKYNRSFGRSHNEGKAEIEVTVVETHANIRVLSPKRLRHLSKLVAAFHNIYLTILHLNVTTLDPLILYSICTKVEEGCQLNSADDIAGTVHHMFIIMEEEEPTPLLPL